MTIEQLQTLLHTYHLRPDKKFGQNFLLDDSVLDKMVDAAQVGAQDLVLEIGPGIGNLTQKLSEKAGAVLAVEKDLRLQELLGDLGKKHANMHVAFSDVLHYDFAAALQKLAGDAGPVPVSYKVVANIPYYVTGKIVQIFLRAPSKPLSITVLVQKEVAESIVAKPGNNNLLALSVQLIGSPRIVCMVPATSFHPAPKVQSAVVHIDIPTTAPYGEVDEKAFFRVARSCFAGKRKQIHNTLSNNLRLAPDVVVAVLKTVAIAPAARPQDLSVEQFIELSRAISQL